MRQTPKPYCYNTGSKALHIYGFCGVGTGDKHFDSESEAIRFAGRQLYLCTTCERNREKLVREKVTQMEEAKKK